MIKKVTACCSSAWRTAGVRLAFASSAHAAQGRRVAHDGTQTFRPIVSSHHYLVRRSPPTHT